MTDLRRLQQWVAAVVEHPSTADVAIRSKAATALIARDDVDGVLVPNARLDAAGMLQVYNGGYLARLLEVLEGDYGAVRDAIGTAEFRAIGARYLQRHPSRHPNLNRLGRGFPAFVQRQRRLPNRRFVTELATLELTCSLAFDAPEFEPVALEQFRDVEPSRWDVARLQANPSLAVLAFDHPVDEFYQAWKADAPQPVPAPDPSWVAVFRKNDRVWRQRLTEPMFAVLTALVAGEPLGQALARAEADSPVAEWFQNFAAHGLFVGVDFGD